jgi:hypothetical protein
VIDTRRWVLAEAWLSLGLRVEWLSKYQAESIARDLWMRDEEERTDYIYNGHGVWSIRGDGRSEPSFGFPRATSPAMGTEAMRHELAHYLIATEEERGRTNFGLSNSDDDHERRALEAEKVIDAVLAACGRIAGLALASGSGRPAK